MVPLDIIVTGGRTLACFKQSIGLEYAVAGGVELTTGIEIGFSLFVPQKYVAAGAVYFYWYGFIQQRVMWSQIFMK